MYCIVIVNCGEANEIINLCKTQFDSVHSQKQNNSAWNVSIYYFHSTPIIWMCWFDFHYLHHIWFQFYGTRYVERFRHGAPVSREHRGNVHSRNEDDFWWLSPPSSTSTPNQPTESAASSKYSQLSSTTETSPKLRRKKFNKASSGSAPLQVCSIIRILLCYYFLCFGACIK